MEKMRVRKREITFCVWKMRERERENINPSMNL